MATYGVEALSSDHELGQFSCSHAGLDRYLREQAGQDARRGAAVTYVLCAQTDREVLGYYTLSAHGIELASVPPQDARKLARYPVVSAVSLGRFAVDARHQGQGFGRRLLRDALQRVSLASGQLGIAVVVVEALDDQAAAFYERHGFRRDRDDALRLFLPVRSLAELFPR